MYSHLRDTTLGFAHPHPSGTKAWADFLGLLWGQILAALDIVVRFPRRRAHGGGQKCPRSMGPFARRRTGITMPTSRSSYSAHCAGPPTGLLRCAPEQTNVLTIHAAESKLGNRRTIDGVEQKQLIDRFGKTEHDIII